MAMLADIPRLSNSQRRFTRARAGIEFAAAGVGFIALLVTEFMHFLLVPDLGRRWERLLAESVSEATVALLTAMLMKAVQRHRVATLLRLQVISEMNQHVRTALTEISVTVESIENQQWHSEDFRKRRSHRMGTARDPAASLAHRGDRRQRQLARKEERKTT